MDKTIYEIIQLEAINAIINDHQDYIERKIKRYISKTYCVNLFELNNISFVELLRIYYESIFENVEEEQLYNTLCNMLPEIVKDQEKVEVDIDKELLKEQEKTVIKQEKKIETEIKATNINFDNETEQEYS